MKNLFILLIITFLYACGSNSPEADVMTDTAKVNENVQIPDIPVETAYEILSPEALKLLDTVQKVEELAKGFAWSEGPLWVESLGALLFSDVPNNKMYKWSEKDSLTVFLDPSGFTETENGNTGQGSNGLALDSEGDLLICQHGDRRIAMLSGGLQNPSSEFITIADRFLDKKFNSPNDLAIKSNGEIYFTDPPYGLVDEKSREIDFNGVFRLKNNGEIVKLTDTIEKPNGIAFSPDEKTLYVANSANALWYSYQIDESGNLTKPMVFFNASEFAKETNGSPDGLKVHKSGTVFASGPGGVYLISPKGKLLARILTSKQTSNCAFDKDQKYLYLTVTDRLMRLKLK